MKKIISLIVIILVLRGIVSGQGNVLDSYIAEGLENNLALKQKEYNYERSLAALQEAKAMFFPDINFNARYTWADGGRVIELPVGDMLNPVYSTLNMLLQTDDFPLIDNQEFALLREHDHETKISVVQPIIEPKIYYNHMISKELSRVQHSDAETYRRQLVADIQTAYFNYLKSLSLEKLLADTKDLLEENVRVNESLFRNDKVTIDNVYRSKAELSQLEQHIAEAEKARQISKAYFNFLLNRPLTEQIQEDNLYDSTFVTSSLDMASENALGKREELAMLDSYLKANNYYMNLHQSKVIPSVFGAVDYGYQGTKYRFTDQYDYWIASVVLRWELFHGWENRSQISQAKIGRETLETKIEETKDQIRLQVIEAYYDLQASEKSIRASGEALKSSRKAFEIVDRKFREGQANLIEYIDARTTMTNAEQTLIINRYDYYIKYVEYERVACLRDIE
jgi:outer membrane protein TolC